MYVDISMYPAAHVPTGVLQFFICWGSDTKCSSQETPVETTELLPRPTAPAAQSRRARLLPLLTRSVVSASL